MKSKKRYCLEDDKKVNHRVVIFIVEPGMSRQGIIHREPGYNIIYRRDHTFTRRPSRPPANIGTPR